MGDNPEVKNPSDSSVKPKIKVLLAEDDPLISQVLADDLGWHGFVLTATKNGAEVISLAEQHEPDVIILDLLLPGMNGKEILVLLKKHEKLKQIPVIVFSNLSQESDKKEAMELGAAKYFIKVFMDLAELRAAIEQLTKKTPLET